MDNLRLPFLAAALLALASLTSPAHAATTAELDAFRNDIQTFSLSPDHEFAPDTLAKAQAFLGAAMLAAENNQQDADNALTAAREALDAARGNAMAFREQYKKLLILRSATREAMKLATKSPDPAALAAQANQVIADLVRASEAGQTGEAATLAAEATAAYEEAYRATLPEVDDITGLALADAASEGAKRYAPVTFGRAKAELEAILAYMEGTSQIAPEHPARGLYLARHAKEIALEVREWRKSRDSHEALVLKELELRNRLATAMGIKTDQVDPLADISEVTLLAGIEKLKAGEAEHRKEIERLKLAQQEEIEARLAQQRELIGTEQAAQVAQLKEAFQAKLERETFEKKRMQKLRQLLGKDDAEIMSSGDGSVLVRLKKLQFAPGKTALGKNYDDFIKKLSAALEVYTDRKVRIEGHTDNVGEVKHNQQLSLKRAESVRQALVKSGVDAARLKALGYGEVRPIASNEFEKGRQMNRRIDVVIEAPRK